ncbi:MAG: hypothetical protein NC078_01945 [Ruminococcus sp.]|nr:hypothetical protein [Ruminococcus sp.]
MSRTKSSLKNLAAAFIGQALGIAVSLVSRNVFLGVLSEEYLGLNGLFSNILTVFSLVELGVGQAMNFSLYKPLSEKNIPLLKSLMRFYKKAYIAIGCLIGITGLAFTPFYTVFMDETPDIPFLTVIYLLFVSDTALSYFFSYKRALILCDEKRYIATVYRYGAYFLLNIAQIVLLKTTGNYLLYLGTQVTFTLAENIAVSKKADGMYPYLKEKSADKLPPEIFGEIKKNVGAMFMHKIGGMAVMSTDNLILSKFAGLTAVGIYSNYYLITNALNKILFQIFHSVTAGVGNLNADSPDKGKLVSTFNKLLFLDFWVFGFSSCCLWSLFDPFISLWLGEQFCFDSFTVLVIVVNFYLYGMRRTALMFKEATGAFYYDRWKPIAESAVNLIASILLVKRIGAAGVFLGTVISTVTTSLWIEPYVVYKYVFGKSSGEYFGKFAGYTAVTVFACAVTSLLCGFISTGSGVVTFVLKAAVCAVVPNVIFLAFFSRSENFAYFRELVKRIFAGVSETAKRILDKSAKK